MTTKKPNAVLYPYSLEAVCVLEHSNMINYNIKVVVTPGKNSQDEYDLFFDK